MLGAIDGMHIPCAPPSSEQALTRDRKGGVTMNCLMACSFDMRFLYVLSGWEGSASDVTMFDSARITDLRIPDHRYYLADAGFPHCSELMVPYRKVRYHLREWAKA